MKSRGQRVTRRAESVTAAAVLAVIALAGLTACAPDTSGPSTIDQTAADADDQALYSEFVLFVESEFSDIEWANPRPDIPRLLSCGADDAGKGRFSSIPAARFDSDIAPEEIVERLVDAYADSDIELAQHIDVNPDPGWVYENKLTGATSLGTEVTLWVVQTTSETREFSLRMHTDTACFTVEEEER